MSLFENDEYQWRETYFIFFRSGDRPTGEAIEAALASLDKRYEIQHASKEPSESFEALTLISPDDYAAMDISLSEGEEVAEQLEELIPQLLDTAAEDEKNSIKRLLNCDNRFDVYHFEQMVFVGRTGEDEDEDDFMDPGSLLIVMERIAELCDGIVVDPQAGCLLQ